VEELRRENLEAKKDSPSNRKHKNYVKLLEERVAEGIEDNKRFFQKYVEMRALAY
jgi:hypothetical protein